MFYSKYIIPIFTVPSHKVFRDQTENIKVDVAISGEISVKTKAQCAMHYFHENTCTQFSYHGDLTGNNSLLGSPTSGQQSEDGWATLHA